MITEVEPIVAAFRGLSDEDGDESDIPDTLKDLDEDESEDGEKIDDLSDDGPEKEELVAEEY